MLPSCVFGGGRGFRARRKKLDSERINANICTGQVVTGSDRRFEAVSCWFRGTAHEGGKRLNCRVRRPPANGNRGAYLARHAVPCALGIPGNENRGGVVLGKPSMVPEWDRMEGGSKGGGSERKRGIALAGRHARWFPTDSTPANHADRTAGTC